MKETANMRGTVTNESGLCQACGKPINTVGARRRKYCTICAYKIQKKTAVAFIKKQKQEKEAGSGFKL